MRSLRGCKADAETGRVWVPILSSCVCTSVWQADRQTDRQAGRRAGRQAGGQADCSAYLDRSQVVREGCQTQPCRRKADGPLLMQACQLSMFADAKRIGCTQHLHKACPLCYVSHKLHHQTLLLFAHCMTISAFRTTNRDLSSTNQQCDLELIAVNMTQYKHDQSCTPVEETELGQAQTACRLLETMQTSQCVRPSCRRSLDTAKQD